MLSVNAYPNRVGMCSPVTSQQEGLQFKSWLSQEAFICGVFMCPPCWCGFPPGALVPHNQKTCIPVHFRDAKLSVYLNIGCVCENCDGLAIQECILLIMRLVQFSYKVAQFSSSLPLI